MPRRVYSYDINCMGSNDSAHVRVYRRRPGSPDNASPATPPASNVQRCFPLEAPKYGSFTQQALMERAIAPLNENDKAAFRSDTGRFLRLRDWDGVSLNSKGEVIAICWESLFDEEGSLEFRWLPRSLKALKASDCNLTGQLDLRGLPRDLVHLNLSTNNYSGAVTLSDLPQAIEAVYLGGNRLEGQLDTSCVPRGLRTLSLGENAFYGPLELRRLPRNMEYLDLSNNRFCDEVFFGNLPPDIVIDLVGNDVDRKAFKRACDSDESLRDQVILEMAF